LHQVGDVFELKCKTPVPKLLINTIHKNPGFKIKAFLIQLLTCAMAVGCCYFETKKKKFAALIDTFRGA